MGGSTDFVRTDQVNVLDLAARRWLDRKPLPFTLSSAVAGVVAGRIVLAGGIATSTGMISPETLALDAAADRWLPVSPMTTPRFAMGAAVVGDSLYVPGGAAQVGTQGLAVVGTLEAFVP